MRQGEPQTWVYKPLQTNSHTIVSLVLALLVYMGVTFSCTMLFFSIPRSLSVPRATLAAFGATFLALLGLFGTLRWWHWARPRLPKLPNNQDVCHSDVPDLNLQDALGDSAANTPPEVGFIITCISYQIVRVADMIFGHRIPPHLISHGTLDEPGVSQETGRNISVGASSPQEGGGKDQNEPTRPDAVMPERSGGSAHRSSQMDMASSPVDSGNNQGVHENRDTTQTAPSRADRRARGDWERTAATQQ